MTADVAICDPCRDGTCVECAGWAWSDAISFPSTCDCAETQHSLSKEGAA